MFIGNLVKVGCQNPDITNYSLYPPRNRSLVVNPINGKFIITFNNQIERQYEERSFMSRPLMKMKAMPDGEDIRYLVDHFFRVDGIAMNIKMILENRSE